ncbi:hypothetical protein AAES_43133 [Amazona aestiva]|uniref:Uncharacterized protein n=1 Tax=Amazona aestiva TaxID=12930 RepID=A0A0Q3PV47_AMAAE|nr:hypothetical protein AAES_43133 [Amazona aestiva]
MGYKWQLCDDTAPESMVFQFQETTAKATLAVLQLNAFEPSAYNANNITEDNASTNIVCCYELEKPYNKTLVKGNAGAGASLKHL